MIGGPPMEARPLMMPETSRPTPKLTSRDGLGGRRTPRWISTTENAMIPPIDQPHRIWRQGRQDQQSDRHAEPAARAASIPTARQSHSAAARRSPAIADDDLKRDHQRHDLGRRQRQTEQRHRGEAKSEAGEAAQNGSGEHARHGQDEAGYH